ncbi:endolytic transglycosylase MltG [Arcanobacterium wilhelmae]|uniref:endolytic transglycosylase MltG n=1 Tax=Arcanobacterium wilhelmae TaxID=1803177 RepID=UPI0024158439|nr:endolytic transglycosylase MltG [Arcanobacterium wilhelmae]WFN89535.1 endolytic transglycosylase MltG [Arcanobacterium wilhelmae]
MSEFFGEQSASESHRAQRRERTRRRKIKTAIALFLTVMLVTGVGFAVVPWVKNSLFATSATDYQGEGSGEVVVTIPEGASGVAMAQILVDNGVVASSGAFVTAFRDSPRASQIQPGSYVMRKKMSGASAVARLLDPAAKANSGVTVVEGFTAKQVFDRMSKVMDIPLEKIVAASKDSAAIGLPEVAKGNVEGWLAPATYNFDPGTSATDALKKMIAKRVGELQELGIAQDQWQRQLIIASIVEREVSFEKYRGQVARVILNRLDDKSVSHGLLQMDSTVLYGVGKSGGVPTADDLKNDNPYNTYIHKGLPPAPISNPSKDVIRDSLKPPAGNWLFFVTVNLETGETKFSDNLDDHNANVAEFRKWVEAHPQDKK